MYRSLKRKIPDAGSSKKATTMRGGTTDWPRIQLREERCEKKYLPRQLGSTIFQALLEITCFI
jgi:hypothetical protein